MKPNRRVIAEVETGEPPAPIRYEVTNGRTVTLRFPQAVSSGSMYGGRVDFTRNLRPEEAREIGQALLDAAAEVEAAS